MSNIQSFPLYDVPYLVREANDSYMSKKRHKIEVQNQAIVDAYFIERDKGLSAEAARKMVAEKHGIPTQRADRIIRWFYEEAKKRRKYDFLQKFSPSAEHITDFWTTFAPDLREAHY